MIQEIKDHQKRKFSDEVLQKKIKDSGSLILLDAVQLVSKVSTEIEKKY